MSNQVYYILRDYIGWGNWRNIKVKVLDVIDKKRQLVLVEALEGEPFMRAGFFGGYPSCQSTTYLDQLKKEQK